MSSFFLYSALASHSIPSRFILAEIYRIQGYDVERTSWTQIGIYVLGAFMIMLAAWQCTILAMRWARKPSQSPNKLLANLMRSHHLSRMESKLIEQLARRLPPSIPATALFIDPELWEQNCASNLKGDLASLKKKLFGD